MARRGENIYKRKDGRWEGRYIKGRKPDGEPRYGSVYGRKYNDVKVKLLPLKCEYANREKAGMCFTGTVRDWAKYWMEEVVKARVRESTYAQYAGTLQNHILPALGDKRLSLVTREDAQTFADSLTKKGLRVNTIYGIFGLLNRMMEAAADRDALLLNPCKGVVLPKREPSEVKALSEREQEQLESAALEDNDGLAVLLALRTGMRIGEISALTWDDVDLERGVLRVRHTVQRIADVSIEGGTKVIIGAPKSAHSRREIPITGTLKQILERERANTRSDHVVSRGSGMAEPRLVRYRLARIATKAGLAGIRFHSLRHTFATRAMETRMNITTLSRVLGHASVKMTLDVYTDSSWEQMTEAMDKLDRMHAGERPRPNAKIRFERMNTGKRKTA